MAYQVAFDLAVGSEGADNLNQGLNSVARFLNMHGAAGVPRERLQVAVVVHGTAAKDFLNAAAFREFAGYDNPNLELIEELAAFGVRFVMCGQSLGARGVPRSELVESVEVALKPRKSPPSPSPAIAAGRRPRHPCETRPRPLAGGARRSATGLPSPREPKPTVPQPGFRAHRP